jgi:hypothetical protein
LPLIICADTQAEPGLTRCGCSADCGVEVQSALRCSDKPIKIADVLSRLFNYMRIITGAVAFVTRYHSPGLEGHEELETLPERAWSPSLEQERNRRGKATAPL